MSADNEYVITGALMKCSEGASPMPFKATPRTSKIAGLQAGNELDIAPILNIPSFIICKKLTQMANGVPVPCVPAATKWEKTYQAKVGGGKALLKMSCIQCAAGQGKIEFITSGQVPLPPEVVEDIQITEQKGKEALEAAENEKNAVGEAGFAEGLIPLWGSGRDFIHAAQTGSVGGMALNGAFFIWDAVSVAAGIVSFGTATAVMMGAKAGIRTALKAAGKVVVSAAKKQGAELLAGSAKMVKNVGSLIKDFLPKMPEICFTTSCFPAGTPIAVKGGFKNIEDIQVGDEVWSWNEERGEIGLKPVINTVEREADALIELGFGRERFRATPEHPFWVGHPETGGWKNAGDLVEGDAVWLLDKRNVALSLVDHQPQEESGIKVFNFEVADWHTYFVSWWMVLVHNNNKLCPGEVLEKIYIAVKDKIDRKLLNRPKKKGNAPTFKKDGTSVEIHHEGQKPQGPYKEMHWKDHRGKGNDSVNHPDKGKPSKINRKKWDKMKAQYWIDEYWPKK
jgi:hypothetical protein